MTIDCEKMLDSSCPEDRLYVYALAERLFNVINGSIVEAGPTFATMLPFLSTQDLETLIVKYPHAFLALGTSKKMTVQKLTKHGPTSLSDRKVN